MVGSGPPRAVQQFDSTEFVERNAPPVSRRSHRFQTTFTFPAKLIAEHSKLSFFVPTQSVRTEKAVKAVISTRDWPPALHSRAHDPVDIIPLSGTASRYNRHASRLLRSNS
jgi:hypothetical protein